jgi:hypothetical protein
MSTVSYKDGIMAADTAAYRGHGSAPMGEKWKVKRLKDGSLLGITSAVVGLPDSFFRLMYGGGWEVVHLDLPQSYDLEAILVTPEGEVFHYNNGPSFTGPLEAEHFAIGSGYKPAMVAMDLGKSAVEAIFIACNYDEHSALPVRSLLLKQP